MQVRATNNLHKNGTVSDNQQPTRHSLPKEIENSDKITEIKLKINEIKALTKQLSATLTTLNKQEEILSNQHNKQANRSQGSKFYKFIYWLIDILNRAIGKKPLQEQRNDIASKTLTIKSEIKKYEETCNNCTEQLEYIMRNNNNHISRKYSSDSNTTSPEEIVKQINSKLSEWEKNDIGSEIFGTNSIFELFKKTITTTCKNIAKNKHTVYIKNSKVTTSESLQLIFEMIQNFENNKNGVHRIGKWTFNEHIVNEEKIKQLKDTLNNENKRLQSLSSINYGSKIDAKCESLKEEIKTLEEKNAEIEEQTNISSFVPLIQNDETLLTNTNARFRREKVDVNNTELLNTINSSKKKHNKSEILEMIFS